MVKHGRTQARAKSSHSSRCRTECPAPWLSRIEAQVLKSYRTWAFEARCAWIGTVVSFWIVSEVSRTLWMLLKHD